MSESIAEKIVEKGEAPLSANLIVADGQLFYYDLKTWMKDKDPVHLGEMLESLVKLGGDITKVIGSLMKANAAFKAIAEELGVVQMLADIGDMIARSQDAHDQLETTGSVKQSDLYALWADGCDLIGSALRLIPTGPTKILGFALQGLAWWLGTRGNEFAAEEQAKEANEKLVKIAIPPIGVAAVTDTTFTRPSGASGTYITTPTGLMSSDAWTSSGNVSGTDQVNPDGSTTGTITYASGAKAVDQVDSNGNETIDYYNANGILISASWIYADGSSGSVNVQVNGRTNETNVVGEYSVPESGTTINVNPDGSYTTTSEDVNNNITTTIYDASGAQTSSTITKGAGSNYFDGGRLTYSAPLPNTNFINTYDSATNELIKDTWAGGANSGTDYFNMSGAENGTVTFASGETATYTIYGGPDDAGINNSVGRTVIVTGDLTLDGVTDAGNDRTLNLFDVNGILYSSDWSLADGTHGSYKFFHSSGSGVITTANGNVSQVLLDGSGDITVNNLDSTGATVSSDFWNADGSHGTTTYNGTAIVAKYTYLQNGTAVIDSYAPDGSLENEQTDYAGAVMSPDSNFFNKVQNGDGTYSIAYTNSNGDSTIFDYTSTGSLTGTDQAALNSNPPLQYFSSAVTDGGTAVDATSPYNPRSALYTDADGVHRTAFFDSDGRSVGDDWKKDDGSYGNDISMPDGSGYGTQVNADGTSYDYQRAVDGSISDQYYDATGFEIGDAWGNSDGTHGSSSYGLDGSIGTTSYAADGTYTVYSKDATGNEIETDYDAAGVKQSDLWDNADGTSGDDTFNADGSSSGEAFFASGNLQDTYTVDTAGNHFTYFYDGNGNAQVDVVADSWTNIDGSHGTDTLGVAAIQLGATKLGHRVNADGSYSDYSIDNYNNRRTYLYTSSGVLTDVNIVLASGIVYDYAYAPDGTVGSTQVTNPDGTYSVAMDDLHGNTRTMYFSAAKLAVSDVWAHRDGSSGTDAFNADGSSTGTIVYADHTTAKFTRTAAGVTTTWTFDANQKATGWQVSTVDAAGNVDTTTYDGKGGFVSSSVTVQMAWNQTTTTVYNGPNGTGQVIGDAWTMPDGTSGSDQLDGAGNKTSSIVRDGYGASTTTFYGNGDLVYTADGLNDTVNANAGNDTLIAGSGHDTFVSGNLSGTGSGSTTFVLSHAATPVTINAGPKDTINLNGLGVTGADFVNGQWTIYGTSWAGGYIPLAIINGTPGFFTLDGSTTMSFATAMAELPPNTQVLPSNSPYNPGFVENAFSSVTMLPMVVSMSLYANGATVTANDLNVAVNAQGNQDKVIAGNGNQTLSISGSQDTLVGGSGADLLSLSEVASSGLTGGGMLVGGTGATNFAITNNANLASTVTIANSTAQSTLTVNSSSWITGHAVENVSNVQQLADGTIDVSLTGIANVDVIIGDSGTYLGTIWNPGGQYFISYTLDGLMQQNASQRATSGTSVTLAYNTVVMNLTGNTGISATGNKLDDLIYANTGNDTLIAGSAADTLVSGNGNNSMIGGSGRDWMLAGSGSDTMVSGTGAMTYVASTGTTTLVGAKASDTLNYGNIDPSNITVSTTTTGGVTTTTLTNALGGSVVLVNGGTLGTISFGSHGVFSLDQLRGTVQVVQSSTSGTLAAGVSSLQLTGSAGLWATGNNLNDLIVANSGNDVLTGAAGVDTLVAGAGHDTLVAGSGQTYMTGGTGATTFVINSALDVITQADNGQVNTVVTSVSTTLGANLRNLTGTGMGSLVLTGNDLSNVITANTGNDTLIAGSGNSTLIGGNSPVSGLDEMFGGAGSTTMIGGGGYNILHGGTGSTLMIGGTNGYDHDTLIAGSGPTTMIAGSNYTTFVLDNPGDVIVLPVGVHAEEQVGFSTTIATGVESLTGIGTAAIVLTGGGADGERLTANNGDDTLVSGTGITTLYGQSGNNVYIVNNSSDQVRKMGDGGQDIEETTVSIALGTYVSSLVGLGNAALTLSGNQSNAGVITGNAGADTLVGGGFNDTLVAGSGANTLVGGTGNDTFVVNSALDVIVEAANTGANVEVASFSTTLAANVQTLMGSGSGNLTLTGLSSQASVLVANAGNDTLVAGGGVATLVGGSGSATLVGNGGGTGAATTYEVDAGTGAIAIRHAGSADVLAFGSGITADSITASSTTGIVDGVTATIVTLQVSGGNTVVLYAPDLTTVTFADGSSTTLAALVTAATTTLKSAVSATLGAGQTRLVLTGNGDLVGTGNDLADKLIANSGNDTLIAGTGLATMVGGAGNDVFVVNNASDVITKAPNTGNNVERSSVSVTLADNVQNLVGIGSGAITLTGNALANVITANDAGDTLVAGSGLATLVGGAGNDVFVVNAAADVISKAVNAGNNTERASVSVTLADNVQNLTGIGSDAITLTGNALANVITANDAGDTLVAGSGLATLVGGAGNDTFLINNAADVVTKAANSGSNVEQSSVSVTLAANVQNLTGSGGDAITLTGNSLANVIQSNSGADTLIAGSGVATLVGGAANNVFVVNNASDVISKASNSGNNTELTSVSVTLAANVQNLTAASGTAALKLTGNSLSNVITANDGNDTLVAGTGLTTLISGLGIDSLVGGTANDVFVVNNASDIISKATNTGSNLEQASVSVTLAANVQNLTGIGGNALVLTGNSLKNVITANNAGDTLIAGSGLATLVGGTGNDTFVVNNASDVITKAANSGNNTEQASVSVTLAANVQNLTAAPGTTALKLTGNSLNNVITANNGNDTLVAGSGLATLISGTGIDSLVGGTGNDVFVVNNASDTITKATNSGNNTEVASVSVTLAANVQNLTAASGTAALKLTGNSLNNVITANAGNDTLVAGTGSDTLLGAGGNYTVNIGAESDVLTLGDGNDTVTSAEASGNTETMQLGNGNDVITLGSGTDHLTLGNGVDVVNVKAGVDTITLGTGQYTITSTGGVDNVVLTTGAEDKLWFQKVGNNLQVNVLGSSEQITVTNWFTTGTKLNQLTSSDGHTINASGIDQLVQAMASFAPPTGTQTGYTTQEQTALAPVLAANWH